MGGGAAGSGLPAGEKTGLLKRLSRRPVGLVGGPQPRSCWESVTRRRPGADSIGELARTRVDSSSTLGFTLTVITCRHGIQLLVL